MGSEPTAAPRSQRRGAGPAQPGRWPGGGHTPEAASSLRLPLQEAACRPQTGPVALALSDGHTAGPSGALPALHESRPGRLPAPALQALLAGAGGDCWGKEGPSQRPLARPPPGRPPRASRRRRHCLGLPWGRAAAASAAHLSGLTRGCGHHRGARAGGAHARARRLRPHAARRRCGGARGPAGPHAGLGHWPPQRVGGSGRLFPSPPRISPTALRGVQDVPPTSSERSRGTEKGGDSPKVTEPREVPERVQGGGGPRRASGVPKTSSPPALPPAAPSPRQLRWGGHFHQCVSCLRLCVRCTERQLE